MNPDQTQGSSTQLSPDALSATLAHATNLQEQSMPQAPQEAPVEPQEAPSAESTEKPKDTAPDELTTKVDEMEGKLSQGLEDLRNELHATVKSEVSSIKDMIKEALDEQED